MHRLLRSKHTWILAAVLTAMTPQRAEAAKLPAIVNYGEDIFPVGPLPEDMAVPEFAGYQVGMKCSVVGLFWIYLHTWECMPVIYSEAEDSFLDDPELNAILAERYSKSDMQMGFWKGQMRWVLLGILGLGIFFGLRNRGGGDDEGEGEAAAA